MASKTWRAALVATALWQPVISTATRGMPPLERRWAGNEHPSDGQINHLWDTASFGSLSSQDLSHDARGKQDHGPNEPDDFRMLMPPFELHASKPSTQNRALSSAKNGHLQKYAPEILDRVPSSHSFVGDGPTEKNAPEDLDRAPSAHSFDKNGAVEKSGPETTDRAPSAHSFLRDGSVEKNAPELPERAPLSRLFDKKSDSLPGEDDRKAPLSAALNGGKHKIHQSVGLPTHGKWDADNELGDDQIHDYVDKVWPKHPVTNAPRYYNVASKSGWGGSMTQAKAQQHVKNFVAEFDKHPDAEQVARLQALHIPQAPWKHVFDATHAALSHKYGEKFDQAWDNGENYSGSLRGRARQIQDARAERDSQSLFNTALRPDDRTRHLLYEPRSLWDKKASLPLSVTGERAANPAAAPRRALSFMSSSYKLGQATRAAEARQYQREASLHL